MIIYAYAITDSNAGINGRAGVPEGESVYTIAYRDIGIVVSEKEEVQRITRENILRHEEVAEKMMDSCTVLPMRFLTCFKKKEDVLLMMREHYNDFRGNLDRLRGKVEFGIKVIWPGQTIKARIGETFKISNADAPIPQGSPAKNFAKEKLERYRIDKEFDEEADRCIALLDDFFSRFAAEKKLEKLKSDKLLLNAYYLVEKEKEGDFRAAFERAKNTPGDLKYLFSGPWPAYNFIAMTKRSNVLDWSAV